MDGILKRSHIFILIAVLIGALAFVSRPTYAGGAFSEVPYASKSVSYSSAAKRGVVTLKWSKAYSRLEDGTISDASGYEIQYGKNKDYIGAKIVRKGKNTNQATIKLKALNSKKKFNKKISSYHFRIRSYITVDGKRVYSKWTEAATVKNAKVYSPVSLNSIQADRNRISIEWSRVEGASGYIVYGRKAGIKKWKKKCTIKDPNTVSFSEKDLAYSAEYIYSVISYRTQAAKDPSTLNTSCLVLLDDEINVYKLQTKEFSVDTPEAKAFLIGDVLRIKWAPVDGADSYQAEISETQDFSEPRVFKIEKEELPEDKDTYTQEIPDMDGDKDYYVRMKASGTYKNTLFSSEYSDISLVEHAVNLYTIQYDGNYSTSGEMESSIVQTGTDFELPENEYKRDGYEFIGWCLDENNEITMDPIRIGTPDYMDQQSVRDLAEVDGTITLHACWQGTGPEAAADWAALIAADDEFVYGPVVRNTCWFCKQKEKHYVCNSLVAAAYTHGMPYFQGYVAGSTRYTWWVKKGFKDIGENVPISEIRKGDIISCWVKKENDWGHIMIASTDGNVDKPLIAHAAGRGSTNGMGPESIREDPMAKRLAKYSKYHVVRYVG